MPIHPVSEPLYARRDTALSQLEDALSRSDANAISDAVTDLTMLCMMFDVLERIRGSI